MEIALTEPIKENFKREEGTDCKICGYKHLTVYMHTAKCKNCGVLLYYPYPEDQKLEASTDIESIEQFKIYNFNWYRRSAKLNHSNFTNMFLFSIENSGDIYSNPVKILDYGGGGGQFALICKSFLPLSEVYIVDIYDNALLEAYRGFNNQIKWNNFLKDETKFDYIFLNDVFEHVNDPLLILETLSKKLSKEGKLFIDTPRQFWLYPVLKFIYKPLYDKLLKGTVSTAHLQIWTEKSFSYVIDKAGFKIQKYVEVNEFTMKPDHYLRNMGITNKFLLSAGNLFYKMSKQFVRNKIMCLLVKK